MALGLILLAVAVVTVCVLAIVTATEVRSHDPHCDCGGCAKWYADKALRKMKRGKWGSPKWKP